MLDGPFLGSTSPYSRQRLRARAFRRVTRDVYVRADQEPSLLLRVRALQTALPDATASHGTAARLLGLPVPPEHVLHLTRPTGASASERDGVRTHRRDLSPTEVVEHRGARLTGPVRCWVDLAATLSPVALVVLGDAVARRAGVPVLERAVAAARGQRGVVRAREALPRLDPRSDSPAETHCRLVLRAAGLRHLQHAVEVRDEDGGWLATADLGDPLARVALQYDGLVHLQGGPERWRADIARDELVRAQGWQVVVATAHDLRRPDALVARVLAAYARSGVPPYR